MDDRTQPDPTRQSWQEFRLLLYLMPVFGVIPALVTLNRTQSDRQERQLSRAVLKLALAWLAGSVLLDVGGSQLEGLHLPLLLATSLLTSGYFVLNLCLMIRLWQRKSVNVPLLGRIHQSP
jgi:hypothetical protein